MVCHRANSGRVGVWCNSSHHISNKPIYSIDFTIVMYTRLFHRQKVGYWIEKMCRKVLL